MLGKVLKNEWKGTYRIGCLMLIVLVGVTFLGWLAFQSPMWQELSNETYYYRDSFGVNILNLVSVCTLILYAVMLAAVAIGIIAYLGVRFYRTMYTDEGYLTHTLPVTEGRLLFAKTFISGIWSLIISLGIIVSVLALFAFMISAMLPKGYSLSDFWWEFQNVYDDEFRELFELVEAETGMNFRAYFIYMIVSLVLGSFTSIMTLFGAISMGQLFTKHRVLMAIVSYIGVNMVKGIFGSVVEGIVTNIYAGSRYDSPAVVGSYINTNMIISFVLSLIFAVLLYLVSWLVNTRKLNME
ncbi:MAG: hypothetical protein NC123_04565 [Butyrivibrio sp.]|nr:hypothetical protein [Acetatifactor muris]MCM1558801.1 hypothetical protein [Butyrivibrio sp.]